MNPLLSKFNTPHNTYPFNMITPSHIEEAIYIGIEKEKEEIRQICEQKDKPSFENTIVSFENTGKILSKATTLLFNLLSADRSVELENLAEKVVPIITEHENEILQNKQLYSRVEYVKENYLTNDSEEQMLVKKTYEAFVHSGISLVGEEQKKFNEIKSELAKLKLEFSKNLIADTNDFKLFIEEKDKLEGLPDFAIQQAAAKAKDISRNGWIFDLHAPAYIPFITYAKDRELRKKMYLAYNSRGNNSNANNNVDICKKIINLKQQLGHILGYSNYAEFVLKNRMAENIENVYQFLNKLKCAYLPFAHNEVREIKQYAKSVEGDDFELQPWDFAYYSEGLKRKKFNVDAEQLRPYFELTNVINGVFSLSSKLYGIKFVENKEIDVYNNDVKAYDVIDSDGTYLAVLYTDFFPRATKQGGAWMTSFLDQDENNRPHVSIVMNFTPPTEDKPSLLTFDEIKTFLHEFGHALHGIFANTKYSSLSGTNVYWDFVELPSQIMENFAYEYDFIMTIANHYKNGEIIPKDLLENTIQSRNFNVAYACIRQLSFGLLDMAYYTLTEPFKADLSHFEREILKDVSLLPSTETLCMTTHFSHIMDGGYSAGYYSYKWAEVLDADAFSVFKKNGILNNQTAEDFRHHILSQGGTVHPMILYKNFRKDTPTIDALLERDGLKNS